VPEDVLAGLNALAERLLGRPRSLATPSDAQRFLSRVGEVIEVFVSSAQGLLRGFERLEPYLPTSLLGRDAPPMDIANKAELERALFDWTVEAYRRAPDWLAGAFKNVMVQQIALLSGAMEGVRTLLDELSPQRIEASLEKTGRGRVLKRRQLWLAYKEQHERLSEQDQETFEKIFGTQLAKAYAELVGEGGDSGHRRSTD
jgi:hypothetical protein